ncbi:hypothetical protein [Spongiactinospora gelatinilytica]|uniref:hypothetical protein n=1 Tax=Spongiactinospora gelatinilytica TaxID=2666298 RepID=UPI0011B93D05|nr:hypothetical protein [Spongiactinospora gelatinilytica]
MLIDIPVDRSYFHHLGGRQPGGASQVSSASGGCGVLYSRVRVWLIGVLVTTVALAGMIVVNTIPDLSGGAGSEKSVDGREIEKVADTPFLKKAAKDAGKSHQKSLDHMFKQLSEGNMNPGIGSSSLGGTDVLYARSRDGARLFFRKIGDRIIIVGKANKGNEGKVIERLKKLYGR